MKTFPAFQEKLANSRHVLATGEKNAIKELEISGMSDKFNGQEDFLCGSGVDSSSTGSNACQFVDVRPRVFAYAIYVLKLLSLPLTKPSNALFNIKHVSLRGVLLWLWGQG